LCSRRSGGGIPERWNHCGCPTIADWNASCRTLFTVPAIQRTSLNPMRPSDSWERWGQSATARPPPRRSLPPDQRVVVTQ
jgi:hypothetical protein